MIRYNMNKISLKPNDKVSKYLIDSVTGYGASCIVYKAWYKEDNNSEPHWVQLKELYPYDIGLFRDASNNLICKTEEDKKKFDEYKKNFEASNNMLVKLNRLTDSTPCEIQSFPYNGTKYSIVAYSNGKQYSEKALQKIELNKLLGIIESLAISVNRLHEEGYLHLDIKPDNFLINDIGSAILFDVDSVVPIDEIKYRNGISYSKKWAAPEVKQAAKKSDYKDISCKSDIFSIGVILFEAIMGRDFLPMETVSYNRNWDVENSIKAREEKQNRKVNISPKFYHHLKEIFEKTLDRNPNNRYENLEELKAALVDAKTLYNEKMFLLSNCPIATTDFVGRKDEIKKINGALLENANVFLSGMGGIGKTELARKYAKIHKDDYDTIVYLKYTGDLKTLIKDIKICGYTESSAEESNGKIDELKKLLNERTLLIIDNFDISNDEKDEYLSCLLSEYNCKKLITTRNDFPQQKNAVQIKIGELSKSEAKELFLKNYEKEMSKKDEKALERVLATVEYLTLCIPILAQQCNSSDITVSDMEEKLSAGMAELDNMENITAYKDDDTVENTIPQYMKAVFNIADLNDEKKRVLSKLSLLQFMYVTRKEYKSIALYGIDDEKTRKKELDMLNSLVKQSWVKKRSENGETYYELHSLINELVKSELSPNPKNCNEVFSYVEGYAIFEDKRNESSVNSVNTMEFAKNEFLYGFICSFIDNINLCDKLNLVFAFRCSKVWRYHRIIPDEILYNYLDKDIYDNDDWWIFANAFMDFLKHPDFNLCTKLNAFYKTCTSSFESGCLSKRNCSYICWGFFICVGAIIDEILCMNENGVIYADDMIDDAYLKTQIIDRKFIEDIMIYKKYVIEQDEWFREFEDTVQKYLDIIDAKPTFIETLKKSKESKYEEIIKAEDTDACNIYNKQIDDLCKKNENNGIKLVTEFYNSILLMLPKEMEEDIDVIELVILNFCANAKNLLKNNNCIKYVAKIFEYLFNIEEYCNFHEFFDIKIASNAVASLICGNRVKFNEYMNEIICQIAKQYEEINYRRSDKNVRPTICFHNIEVLEALMICDYENVEINRKQFIPFYYKVARMIEEHFEHIVDYNEVVHACYNELYNKTTSYKLDPTTSIEDAHYKEIQYACRKKIDALIGAKKLKNM